ncbi:MAG: HAD family phosphatase [Bacteroidales bacterium]|nr:HAD family phosphatase [Bacteroidales bacterium]
MVSAIVFDIGGVLVDLDVQACLRAFREDLGFERITELLDPSHQKGIYGEMEAGRLSADHFRELILAESRPGSTKADVDRAMGALLVGMPPVTARLVNELSTRYPLYLLSNNNPISMARTYELFREAGVDPQRTFKAQFISCDMQLMKPSQECYREVVRRIGLPAEEILFIDDNGTNVEAARVSGMQARYYAPGSDMSLLLADL